jgi:hypothetical protein
MLLSLQKLLGVLLRRGVVEVKVVVDPMVDLLVLLDAALSLAKALCMMALLLLGCSSGTVQWQQ